MSDDTCPACGTSGARPSLLGFGEFDEFRFRYLTCSDCASHFVSPMPSAEVLARLYAPEYLAEHYAQGTVDRELSDETDEVVRRVADGGRVLDVGCGAGAFLERCRSRGLAVEGFEYVSETAAMVSARLAIPVHTGRLSALAGGYDSIHVADVLEHSPDPAQLLGDAKSLLRPGGTLIARGPLEGQPTLFHAAIALKRWVAGRLRPPGPSKLPPWHLVLFSLRGWRALFQRAGLAARDEISETWWPVPEAARSPLRIVKAASRTLTRSAVGRRFELGNRVVTWARLTTSSSGR